MAFHIANFDVSTIGLRPDGSYVVNKGMFHVPNAGNYAGLFAEVDAYAKEHPEVVVPDSGIIEFDGDPDGSAV